MAVSISVAKMVISDFLHCAGLAREGWRSNIAAGLQTRAVHVNCDEPHTRRDELLPVR
jgi:hypothetical protein